MLLRDLIIMALTGLILVLAIAGHARILFRYSWQDVGYITVGGIVFESIWCVTLFTVYVAHRLLLTS